MEIPEIRGLEVRVLAVPCLSQGLGYLVVCAFRFVEETRKMLSQKVWYSTIAIVLCLSFSVSAAEKKSKDAKADEANKSSYELAQPATENLDYSAPG